MDHEWFKSVSNGKLERIRDMLDDGINPNKPNIDSIVPIYLACKKRNFDVAKLLLDTNKILNSDKHKSLITASNKNCADIVLLFLDNTLSEYEDIKLIETIIFNTNRYWKDHNHERYQNVLTNLINFSNILLNNKLLQDKLYELAIRHKLYEIVILLDKKYNIELEYYNGIVYILVKNNDIDLLLKLSKKLEKPIELRDMEISTYYCIENSKYDMLKLLVDNKIIDIISLNTSKFTNFLIAAINSTKVSNDIIKLLINNGASLSRVDSDELTSLEHAINTNNSEIVKLTLPRLKAGDSSH